MVSWGVEDIADMGTEVKGNSVRPIQCSCLCMLLLLLIYIHAVLTSQLFLLFLYYSVYLCTYIWTRVSYTKQGPVLSWSLKSDLGMDYTWTSIGLVQIDICQNGTYVRKMKQ